MAADLESPDEEVRGSTISNLFLHSPPLAEALPLLHKAMDDPVAMIREHAFAGLHRLGSDLTKRQAETLEKGDEIRDYPLEVRWVLLSYYFRGQFASDSAKISRRRFLLWLYSNAPEIETGLQPICSLFRSQDPAGYEEAKAIWLAHVEANPKSPKILANAAAFFVLNDFDLAERFMLEGGKLEPTNPAWRDRLGELYSLQAMRQKNSNDAAAAKGLAAYQSAEKLRETQTNSEDDEVAFITGLLNRMESLEKLANAALAARELEQARGYAEQLLELATGPELAESGRVDGASVHLSHTVLGHVALAMGDLATAKRHLLASGKVTGTPTLVSFGPNMGLAKEFLERKQPEVVLEYFELCREFWHSGLSQLDSWTADVKNGVMPDFGANLRY